MQRLKVANINIFKPAIALMNQLKYPQKFALISLLFAMPVMLMMYLLVTEIHTRIDFAQKEIYGNIYLRPVRQIWEQMLRSQTLNQLADRALNQNLPTGAIRDRNSQIETQINQSLQKLEAVDQKYGQALKTSEKLTNLKQSWQTFSQQNGLQTLDTRNAYRQLIYQIEKLRSHVGDTSNLILDPDLDTYYLMDSSLLKLPAMQKVVAEVQLLSLRIINRKQITAEERGRLVELSGLLKEQSNDLSRNMEVGFSNNLTGILRLELAQPLAEFLKDTNQLTDVIDGLIDPNTELSTSTYALAETNLAKSFSFWDRVVDELDLLLQKRIDGFAMRQKFIAIFVVIILLLVTYLFIAFYAAVMHTVQSLDDAAKRMTSGSASDGMEIVTLNTQDELGEVVQSFNSIATALVTAIATVRQAEENYRSIFENAIEGIFQTTPDGNYKSINPALVRIYGYESATDMLTSLTKIEEQLYVDPNRRQEFTRLMTEHGKVIRFESEVYRKDGSTIWISENAHAVYDDQGELIYYEGSVEDISDRVAAEQSLAKANLEITLLNERLQAENLRMSSELAITRRLQRMILPKDEELENIEGLDIAGFMEPAAEVGGDYYDVLQHEGKVKIGIGDVTGHGLESGVVMIMAQTAVRTLLANNETNPIKFLNALNLVIYGNTRRMESLKNMSLAIIDYEAGLLRLSGQHEEMIIVRNTGEVEQFDTLDLGFPIGIESDITPFIAEIEVKLDTGDIAVLYTDGITEAVNDRNEQYGLERMYAVLKQNFHKPANEIRQAVIDHVMQHIGSQKIYDDITLLILKQK